MSDTDASKARLLSFVTKFATNEKTAHSIEEKLKNAPAGSACEACLQAAEQEIAICMANAKGNHKEEKKCAERANELLDNCNDGPCGGRW